MADVRKGVTEFIRAGKSLLEMKALSEDEEQVVRDMLWQLVMTKGTMQRTKGEASAEWARLYVVSADDLFRQAL
jgi:hypothetical protein